MKITREIKGRDVAIAKISIFNYKVHEGIADQIDETSKNVRNRERQRAPVGKAKRYKKSIGRKIKRDDLFAKVGPMRKSDHLHPLAHLLERGTSPHPIHPYGNKTATVIHPGTKAQPHVEPAWDAEEPAFIRGVENAIRRAGR